MSISKDELIRSSLLKIGRAEHHVHDVSRLITDFLTQKPLRLCTIGDPKTGQITHFLERKAPIPDEVALTIGDAVHNLRSSLDLLMFRMIGDKARRPENVQFPFPKRKDSLVSTMQSRETNLAGEKVVAEIEALEPYPGGNEWLSGLHLLDIMDKHKLIVPVTCTARMSPAEFDRMIPGIFGMHGVETGNIVWYEATRFILRNANHAKIHPGKYERDIQPSFRICFDEGQPFAARAVVPTLAELTNCVRKAVIRIADAFIQQI